MTRPISSMPARCAGSPATARRPSTAPCGCPGLLSGACGPIPTTSTSTRPPPRTWPASRLANIPLRYRPPLARSARNGFGQATYRSCSVRRRWSSASTSPISTPSIFAMFPPPRPTTPSAPVAPAGAASRLSWSPTARPAARTTNTSSSARSRWWPERSPRPVSTSPTKSWFAPMFMRSGSPRVA